MPIEEAASLLSLLPGRDRVGTAGTWTDIWPLLTNSGQLATLDSGLCREITQSVCGFHKNEKYIQLMELHRTLLNRIKI